MMKSSSQVMSPRAFPGHQKGKSIFILLTTRWKSYGREGEEEREEGEDKGDGMDEEDDGDEGEVGRKATEEGSSKSLGDVHTRRDGNFYPIRGYPVRPDLNGPDFTRSDKE